MKLEPINKPRTKRMPLRSFVELAKEAELSCAVLRGMMAKHEDAPKPRMQFERASYYEPVGFRKWLRARLA